MLDFGLLQEKPKSVQLDTVLVYVTAISNRHAPVQGQPLTADRTVRKWVSGLKLTKCVVRFGVPAWSLDLVLAALKRQHFKPIRNTSL